MTPCGGSGVPPLEPAPEGQRFRPVGRPPRACPRVRGTRLSAHPRDRAGATEPTRHCFPRTRGPHSNRERKPHQHAGAVPQPPHPWWERPRNPHPWWERPRNPHPGWERPRNPPSEPMVSDPPDRREVAQPAKRTPFHACATMNAAKSTVAPPPGRSLAPHRSRQRTGDPAPTRVHDLGHMVLQQHRADGQSASQGLGQGHHVGLHAVQLVAPKLACDSHDDEGGGVDRRDRRLGEEERSARQCTDARGRSGCPSQRDCPATATGSQ
jgi:hypothetical protein